MRISILLINQRSFWIRSKTMQQSSYQIHIHKRKSNLETGVRVMFFNAGHLKSAKLSWVPSEAFDFWDFKLKMKTRDGFEKVLSIWGALAWVWIFIWELSFVLLSWDLFVWESSIGRLLVFLLLTEKVWAIVRSTSVFDMMNMKKEVYIRKLRIWI